MKMKKFINDTENLVQDMINGYTAAYAHSIQLVSSDIIIRKTPKAKGKTYLVFGQGAGHEPGFSGMLGFGVHDVEILGGVFSCASSDRIYEGIKLAWEMSGNMPVLVLVANHEGDVINNEMAIELAEMDGIEVKSIVLYDDIASAPLDRISDRRGMAGMTFSFKIAGAMAEAGHTIDQIIEKISVINNQTRTLAVAMKTGTNPLSGQPLFDLEDDELVIGPGAHGEIGAETIKIPTAKEIMRNVTNRILKDGNFSNGDNILVLLNGLGSTTLMELFILYNELQIVLKEKELTPFRPLIGNYVTTQEMAGFSVSFCNADEQAMSFWEAPADTPFFKMLSD
jgi:phosphoenolpyruvate---glycerone phosphotransferase subunit DhaK